MIASPLGHMEGRSPLNVPFLFPPSFLPSFLPSFCAARLILISILSPIHPNANEVHSQVGARKTRHKQRCMMLALSMVMVLALVIVDQGQVRGVMARARGDARRDAE